MEMPPIHMCAFLNHENARLKEKIINLKRQRSELEQNLARRNPPDHVHSCTISCQTDLDLRLRPNRTDSDELTRLQRLLQSQNELLKKYEIPSTNDRSPSKLCDTYEQRLKQAKLEKEQAEQRATQAEQRLAKLEERYERMRKEISVLDENFFEELEDLKFALQQANNLNREYERTVQMLSTRLGITLSFQSTSFLTLFLFFEIPFEFINSHYTIADIPRRHTMN